MRTHTGRWRIWEWKQKSKYSHSSQKGIANVPHFHQWQYIFWPCHTTYHSWTTPRTLHKKIQKLQPCLPPFSVYQLWWREPCKNMWSTIMMLQYTIWQPTPEKSRTLSMPSALHGHPQHSYTMLRWFLPGCYSRRRRFSHSTTGWWHLVRRSSSRQALLHPWTVTTAWPVPLSLPI